MFFFVDFIEKLKIWSSCRAHGIYAILTILFPNTDKALLLDKNIENIV